MKEETLPVQVPEANVSKRQKRRIERVKELEAKKLRLMEDTDITVAEPEETVPAKVANSKSNLKRIGKSKKKSKSSQRPLKDDTADSQNNPTGDSSKFEPPADIDMSAWDALLVPEEIKKALAEMNFCNPTDIQNRVSSITVLQCSVSPERIVV